MHNLEKSIAEWRKTMMADPASAMKPSTNWKVIYEKTWSNSSDPGMTEPEAFQQAVAQLGGARTIASEFRKLDQSAVASGEAGRWIRPHVDSWR